MFTISFIRIIGLAFDCAPVIAQITLKALVLRHYGRFPIHMVARTLSKAAFEALVLTYEAFFFDFKLLNCNESDTELGNGRITFLGDSSNNDLGGRGLSS